MDNNLIYQYYLPYSGPLKRDDTSIPDWAELGVASAKKYASLIGVEYEFSDKIIINAPNQNLESARIFLDPKFDKYDKILLLDIDTLVATKKNIFDVQISDLGMIQDGGPGSPRSFINNIVSQLEAYGNIKFPNSITFPSEKRYLNGGVQVWSREGRLKARDRFGGLAEMFRYRETLKMNEQPYINLMINLHDIEITEMPNMWNRMNYMWRMGIPDGYINHFLALQKKKMKDYAYGL